MNIPNETQEGRVLTELKNGEWVSKSYMERVMMLSQAGRAIFNLENNPKWQNKYLGYEIEHSPFKDQYGFKSFRLIKKSTLF